MRAKMLVWNLAWFDFANQMAKLIGCAVVYDAVSRTCHVVGNRQNVEALLAAHKDCYETLRSSDRELAVKLASQACCILRTERRPKREERLQLDMVAWKVIELFPELRDLAHPRDAVLKPHGGHLHLGGILPHTKGVRP
jgi:hypothetical protein